MSVTRRILLLISLALFAASVESRKVECNAENLDRVDACAAKIIMIGPQARPLPETAKQLKQYCSTTGKLVKCVKDFTDKCAKGIQKTVANVALYSVRHTTKKYCTRRAKRDEFISMAKCGNLVKKETSVCLDNFLRIMGAVQTHSNDKQKIPMLCCQFYTLRKCILQTASEKGGQKCGADELSGIDAYVDSLAGNILNLVCAEYEAGSDKCLALPKIELQSDQEKPKSLTRAIANVLTSF